MILKCQLGRENVVSLQCLAVQEVPLRIVDFGGSDVGTRSRAGRLVSSDGCLINKGDLQKDCLEAEE